MVANGQCMLWKHMQGMLPIIAVSIAMATRMTVVINES